MPVPTAAMPRAERRGRRRLLPPLAGVAALTVLGGCGAGVIDGGVFHSGKGYRVRLPGEGWQVDRAAGADLALRRIDPQGGILVDATCDPRAVDRPLPLLSRHLVFGLAHRSVVEQGPVAIAGRDGLRSVVRGERDGVPVEVEAVVVKDRRCVYDFLYVAPAPAFAGGRAAFRAFVESLAVPEP